METVLVENQQPVSLAEHLQVMFVHLRGEEKVWGQILGQKKKKKPWQHIAAVACENVSAPG